MGWRWGRMALALGVAAGLVAPAATAAESAASAAATRQHNFKQLGAAFKALSDELKKPAPDKTLLTTNATKMNALATAEASWFPNGSGPAPGLKTAAKPEIWSDPAGFTAAIQRLQGETGKLQQLAAAGDVAAVKGEVPAVGAACKNCHEKYRVPDRH